MLDLLGGIFTGFLEFLELIADIFFNSTQKTDLNKNIKELNKQEWFNQLYNDYRYEHVIHHA